MEYKPHPSPFTLALKKLAVLPDAVLFVGDNPSRDIKGAKAVGMRTCLAKVQANIQRRCKIRLRNREIRRFIEGD